MNLLTVPKLIIIEETKRTKHRALVSRNDPPELLGIIVLLTVFPYQGKMDERVSDNKDH